MKKFLVLVCLVFPLLSGYSFGNDDAKTVLKSRLNKLDGFYSEFSQTVKTQDGELVQEGLGKLWLSRPYYFNWSMSEPDELSIISDGEVVWIYMPMVEQVTALWLKNISDNRLLLLISDSQSEIWDMYNVTNKVNFFQLDPIDNVGQHFKISVLPNGNITNFTIIEEDGQYSYYKLSHQKLGPVDKQKFTFTIPDGVTLDDQRQ